MIGCSKYITNQKLKIKNLDVLYEKSIELFKKELVDVKMYQLYGYSNKIDRGEIDNRSEQQKFREAVVNRYSRCIVTGDNKIMCEACHIESHAETKNNDPSNGILLTATLHILFDSYFFTIDSKTSKCMFLDTLLNNPEFHNVVKYHNKQLDNIPAKTREYLQEHNRQFRMLNTRS